MRLKFRSRVALWRSLTVAIINGEPFEEPIRKVVILETYQSFLSLKQTQSRSGKIKRIK